MRAVSAVYYTILLLLLTGALSSKLWMDAQMVKAVEVDTKQDVNIALNAASIRRLEAMAEKNLDNTDKILIAIGELKR